MTSKVPEKDYTEPTILACPQNKKFHPILAEYFPAFTHNGFLYAPATSVAKNRSFQTIFRAPIEEAHKPNAWEIVQYGSVWHDIPYSSAGKEQGIWGQTFSAQCQQNILRCLHFSKTKDNIGTVHLSRRDWNKPYKDGFTLSAAYARSMAILRPHFREFQLAITLEVKGDWGLYWNCVNPLGPNNWGADNSHHKLMYQKKFGIFFSQQQWEIVYMIDEDKKVIIADGIMEKSNIINDLQKLTLKIINNRAQTQIMINDHEIWNSSPSHGNEIAKDTIEKQGRIELVANQDAILNVNHFYIKGDVQGTKTIWLPMEALAGAAIPKKRWKLKQNPQFYFGEGYISTHKESRAKWNFYGEAVALYTPKGPKYGKAEVFIGEKSLGIVDFHAKKIQKSSMILQENLPLGYHSLTIQPVKGKIPLDIIKVN
jgi:hypothetical protein